MAVVEDRANPKVQPLPPPVAPPAPKPQPKHPPAYRLMRIRRKLEVLVGGPAMFLAVSIVATLLFISCVTVYVTERHVHSHPTGIFAVIWWAFLTLTGNKPWTPEGPAGKVVLYVMDALKPVSIGLIIAALTSNLVQFLMRGGQGKGRAKLKDHIVLCGWSSKGAEIIDQLRRRGDDAGRSPVVILAKLNGNPSKDDLTTFISGDPTNPEDLVRAGITQAKTAIILADNSIQGQDVEDADSRSLLTVLAVESLAPQVYTCVEVVRNENTGHFRRTKADEIVVSARMTGSLLAHSAATHGLSKVVGELLAFPEGNEFYWLPVPAWLIGKNFGDALVELKQKANCLPIAVATGEEAYKTNPAMDHPIRTGDRLLVIAEAFPKV